MLPDTLALGFVWLSAALLLPAAVVLPCDHRSWPMLVAAVGPLLLFGFADSTAPAYWPLFFTLLLLLYWIPSESRAQKATGSGPRAFSLKLAGVACGIALLVAWLLVSTAGLPVLPVDVPPRSANVGELLNDMANNTPALVYLACWLLFPLGALALRGRGRSAV